MSEPDSEQSSECDHGCKDTAGHTRPVGEHGGGETDHEKKEKGCDRQDVMQGFRDDTVSTGDGIRKREYQQADKGAHVQAGEPVQPSAQS